MPPNRWGVTYDSSRRFEQLIQIISIPYKGLSEHEKETIRIAHRDYLNKAYITYFCNYLTLFTLLLIPKLIIAIC